MNVLNNLLSIRSLTDWIPRKLLGAQQAPVCNIHTNNCAWNYSITGPFAPQYTYEQGQSLLEINYRVLLHNWLSNDLIALTSDNFDVVVPLGTRPAISTVNILWFFYSTRMNLAVLAFTGTYNDILILYDLNYSQVDPNLHNHAVGMKVHSGFWDLYADIREKMLVLLNDHLNADTQLLITGHSLGGATSSLAALDLQNLTLPNGTTITNLIHYSFASPRVFNTVGALHFNKTVEHSFRIVNGSDIIPTLPLPVMGVGEDYKHTKNLYQFEDNRGDYYHNHTEAYIDDYKIPTLM